MIKVTLITGWIPIQGTDKDVPVTGQCFFVCARSEERFFSVLWLSRSQARASFESNF